MGTHCKKFGKTDWDILRDVAEHSNPIFAKQILKRNLTALKELRKLKASYNKNPEQGECLSGGCLSKYIHLGCPHCNGCEDCLWTNAYCEIKKCENINTATACLEVLFYGVSARDANFIVLSRHAITVRISNYLKTQEFFAQEFFEKAVAFLKGHIEWARKPYWGKKFKQGELPCV